MPAEDFFTAGSWGFTIAPNTVTMGLSVASNSIYSVCITRIFVYSFVDTRLASTVSEYLVLFRLARLSSISGGNDITGSAAPFVLGTPFPSQYITIWRNAPTYSISHTFRRFLVTIGQPQMGVSYTSAWELCVPFAVVWEAGCYDVNVQPLTFRPGQHFGIICEATSPSETTHYASLYMEMQII